MRNFATLLVALIPCWLGFSQVQAQTTSAKLEQAISAYNQNNFVSAALQLYEVKSQDPKPANRAQAEYYLGQSLLKLGMYQSALAYFNAAFVSGPQHPYYLKGAEGLIAVAQALKDDTLIPSQLNKHYNSKEFASMDPMVLSRINFYVGLLLYRQEKYGEAVSFLQAVDANSNVYAKALFLQAVIHIRLGARYNLARDEAKTQAEYDQAIKLFETILDLSGHEDARAKAAISKYDNIVRLWQLCTLNMARAYYGKGDFSKAVTYFSRIPRFSQDWPDALFEVGWAHFMNQEYGKTLGTLHTLHNPRFVDLFVPESWILKATVYFQVCLYDEATTALGQFQDEYASMLPKLKEILDANMPYEKYATLLLNDTLAADDPMLKVPPKIRSYILANPRVDNFRSFLRSLEWEASAIKQVAEWQGAPLAKELSNIVDTQRELLRKIAGRFVKDDPLNKAYQSIIGFVNHAKLVKVEITNMKHQMAKSSIPLEAEKRGKLAPRPRVSDETYNYWPVNQEYWQDELGFYEYTVRRACPALKAE